MVRQLFARDVKCHFPRALQGDFRDTEHLLQLVGIRLGKRLSGQPNVQVHGDPDAKLRGKLHRLRNVIVDRRVRDQSSGARIVVASRLTPECRAIVSI